MDWDGGFWIPAFAGMTVRDDFRSEWRGVLFGGLRSFDWLRMNGGDGCLFAGGLAEASVEELAGGGYAVMRLERPELAFHYVDQEAGDGASVAGVFPDDPGKLGVELRLAWGSGPSAAGPGVGCVAGYEVGGVFVSVGGEKPGCLESVADAEVLEAVDSCMTSTRKSTMSRPLSVLSLIIWDGVMGMP